MGLGGPIILSPQLLKKKFQSPKPQTFPCWLPTRPLPSLRCLPQLVYGSLDPFPDSQFPSSLNLISAFPNSLPPPPSAVTLSSGPPSTVYSMSPYFARVSTLEGSTCYSARRYVTTSILSASVSAGVDLEVVESPKRGKQFLLLL